MSKLLSIGIPTYNNPNGLRDQLNNIITQIKESCLEEYVSEILICDNSDNKNTEEMMNGLIPEIPYINYIKNNTNIGFDRNVAQILDKSTGRFCWTLSDNDKIVAGGIKKITEVIANKSNVSHVIINQKESDDIKVFKNMEEAIVDNDYNILGGLISSNVFNKKTIPENLYRYYDNDWIHLSIALETGSNHPVVLIPNVLKKEDASLCTWAKNGKTFHTYSNLHSIMMGLEKFNYTKNFLKKIHRIFILNLPRQIITGKVNGLKINKKTLSALLNMSRGNIFILIISLILLIIPTPILKTLKKWKNT